MVVVFDRSEGEYAVLIDIHDHQIYSIALHLLPASARTGDYLDLTFDAENQPQLTINAEQRQAAEHRIAAKLARLRRGEHLESESD